MDADLHQRIERLEAIEAIRQLASRYALAIDVRDLDALVELFLEDVQVGRDRFGRAALREWFDHILRNRIKQTAHIVMNHVIEVGTADSASGVVYCRAEHELDENFVVQQMQYWDSYSRRDGQWYFRRRIPLAWYATDVLDRPVGDKKIRWPNQPPREGELPGWWPSWDVYWQSPVPTTETPLREPVPSEQWLARVQRKL